LTSFDPQPVWLDELEVVVTEMLRSSRQKSRSGRVSPVVILSRRWCAVDEGDTTVDR
jgi:hypothetical protein